MGITTYWRWGNWASWLRLIDEQHMRKDGTRDLRAVYSRYILTRIRQ